MSFSLWGNRPKLQVGQCLLESTLVFGGQCFSWMLKLMLVFGGQCSRVSLWGGECISVLRLLCWWEILLSVKCYGVRVFRGFSEKSNGSRVVWWVRDHVCVMCETILLIITRFWTQGVTAMQLDAIGGSIVNFWNLGGDWKMVIVEGSNV